MIQILNRYIPFGSFVAMAVWPWMFIRKDKEFRDIDLRHEEIHGAQQKELWLIWFYILYGLSYVVELVRCAIDKRRGHDDYGRPRTIWRRAYYMIPFEREAYIYQYIPNYLTTRSLSAWLQYLD